MLNKESIKSQDGLGDLSEDQLSTIVTLANNTIKSEVATEKGKVFGRFDGDIESLTGIAKEGNEPTHVYLKNAFATKLSSGSPELTKQLEELQAANNDLKSKIKSGGGSEALQAELDKATALVNQLREDQSTTTKTWETKLAEKDTMYNDTLVDNAFNEALAGLKFKDEALIPTSVRNAFVSQVKGELLNKYKTQFTDQEGKRVLEFLGDDGQPVRNEENARYPYTAKELLSKGLETILDTGKQQSGGGSGSGGKKQGGAVNLSEATTQVQADELIVNQLLSDGLVKGTPDFSAKHAEIRTASNVNKLPIQ